MDRLASPDLHGQPAVSTERPTGRARWAAAAVVAALALAAVGLWARYGSAVFVDALGAVMSCF